MAAANTRRTPSLHIKARVVLVLVLMVALLGPSPARAQVQLTLSLNFYAAVCPNLYDTIRAAVRDAIVAERRMGASLIRLFFHDCFIQGCDGSILLDDTPTFTGEKNAGPNQNSVRGYEVIQNIKTLVDNQCGAGIVSCADIVAVAARDSVALLGGPNYVIPLGRRDSRTANQNAANTELPGPDEGLVAITRKFAAKGFTQPEMVALSGAHTVGFSQCLNFRNRIYNERNIDANFAVALRQRCPQVAPNGNTNLEGLDPTPDSFGNEYFAALTSGQGLLSSDQVLFNNGPTDALVTAYANDNNLFSTDFANAMVKMGNLNLLTGIQGEIRRVCSRVN